MQFVCVCHVTGVPITQDTVLDLVLTHNMRSSNTQRNKDKLHDWLFVLVLSPCNFL